MNKLIPMPYKQVLSHEDEIGISILSPDSPHKLLFILIPIAFLFLMRNRDHNIFSPKPPYSRPGSNTYKPIPSPLMSIDTDMLNKITIMLDGLKKAKTIQELRKNMRSDGHQGRINVDMMRELLDVFGGAMGESNKSQIQNVANIMGMVEKVKDVKKIIDIQKSSRADHDSDPSSQINNIIDVIKPMLPEEHAKNIDNFKKIAQMMKIMSAFEGSNEESNDEEETSTDD